MSHYRRPRQADANEKEIVRALKLVGASVYSLHEPCDLVVGLYGVNHLLEVKRPLGPKGGASASKLTPTQEVRFAAWKGRRIAIVRSVDDALDAIGCRRCP